MCSNDITDISPVPEDMSDNDASSSPRQDPPPASRPARPRRQSNAQALEESTDSHVATQSQLIITLTANLREKEARCSNLEDHCIKLSNENAHLKAQVANSNATVTRLQTERVAADSRIASLNYAHQHLHIPLFDKTMELPEGVETQVVEGLVTEIRHVLQSAWDEVTSEVERGVKTELLPYVSFDLDKHFTPKLKHSLPGYVLTPRRYTILQPTRCMDVFCPNCPALKDKHGNDIQDEDGARVWPTLTCKRVASVKPLFTMEGVEFFATCKMQCKTCQSTFVSDDDRIRRQFAAKDVPFVISQDFVMSPALAEYHHNQCLGGPSSFENAHLCTIRAWNVVLTNRLLEYHAIMERLCAVVRRPQAT